MMWEKRRRWQGALAMAASALAVTGFAVVAPGTAQAQESGRDQSCVDTHTPVSIQEGLPALYSIYGRLCTPRGGDSDMVQVLIPGGTYNHNYWDLPYQPERYSYVQALGAKGYTTFNIDRIGTGQSSHPPSPLVTVPSNAYVVHQLIDKLRQGKIGDRHYRKVVLVGHSLGTLTAMVESSRYHDVDGLILTGIQHKIHPGAAPDFSALLWPAVQDPRMRDRDPGYLTTRPGARGGMLFYQPTNADPGAIAADDKYAKDSLTDLELGLFPSSLVDGTTERITAPVLLVSGGKDQIFCGLGGSDCTSADTVRAQEAPHYPHAKLTTFVLPEAGHCINTHRNAPDWYAAADRWLDDTFPRD